MTIHDCDATLRINVKTRMSKTNAPFEALVINSVDSHLFFLSDIIVCVLFARFTANDKLVVLKIENVGSKSQELVTQ